MENENKIRCPECDAEINVNEALFNQLQDQFKKQYEIRINEKEKEITEKNKSIDNERRLLQRERESIKESIENELQVKIKEEKSKLEKSIKSKIEEEKSEEFKALQNELQEKSNQIKELNRTKAEVEKLKREKEELREQFNLEKEKEISKKLSEERQKIKQQTEEEYMFKLKEAKKINEDLKTQLGEAQRKAEQGSVQLQGEIQELEIENILKTFYPIDEITGVEKGQKGADILQTIRNNQGQACGKIYYESKRTKSFQNTWIQKLKEDNLDVKADILVLVTESLPEDITKYSLKDGVWICSFLEFKGLSLVLRYGLIQLYNVKFTQQNKGTKMELLYGYLTSLEFKDQFEAIMEGFRTLQESNNDEKYKMQKIWKEREKQLEKILTNAVNFYGSLKGIVGSSIPQIKMLESDDIKLIE
ncbi:MAG: DUF2130 domain-containing protein [Candidatus Firestonebacteria bacterium]